MKFEEGDVLKMVKVSAKDEEKDEELAILLKNGSIYSNIEDLIFNQNYQNVVINAELRSYKLDAKIIKITRDYQTNNWLFIQTKDDEGKVELHLLHDDKLYKVE